jgi:hypothetical protein
LMTGSPAVPLIRMDRVRNNFEEKSFSRGMPPRTVTVNEFGSLLNWKLKRGSHPFPGRDGGTCINEAALIAAGFKYKPIRSAEEMPECFSRPICNLAIEVNDQARDADRQRLLPYVTRLACADSPEIEARRAAYIHRRTRDYPDYLPFEVGLEALKGAMAIGRQADEVAPQEVRTRMEAVWALRATMPPCA